ncbi:hypothetical protein ASAC_0014 [Acidilobus saccharovorans 345-15]|uniref:Uncharacterized protein n=1 Tax=Acidilobus saccharovorans (strain DSM 16705 / JCM 18335 / VKM B-2471 / 345-15) TaxID=666510 RepID=D9PZD5_ACIS3|nr:hypothetical protein [Acidilobus saccharovorans]ADL18423.1 hypothetical protein ASAC_0014 [Acidilobus saccharovorans 345-15]
MGKALTLIVAPLGSVKYLRPATYLAQDRRGRFSCRVESKGKVPSAAVTYVYLRRMFPDAVVRVLGLVPESLIAELGMASGPYWKAVDELLSLQRRHIEEGVESSSDSCGLLGDFIKEDNLELRAVPLRGTFRLSGGGSMRIDVSPYDSQAMAAYHISRKLLELRAADYDAVYVVSDVTNAPNQLQVMTVRAVQGAASALSLAVPVTLGFSALDPYVDDRTELTLSVTFQRQLPSIRLPTRRTSRLLSPRRCAPRDVVRALVGLHGKPIRAAISSLTAAAASINVGALFLMPYFLEDALEKLEGLGRGPSSSTCYSAAALDAGQLQRAILDLASTFVEEYFTLTKVTQGGDSVEVTRYADFNEDFETMLYLALAGGTTIKPEGGCLNLNELAREADNYSRRGLGITITTEIEHDNIVNAINSSKDEVKGRLASDGVCLYELKGHTSSSVNNEYTARNLVAHAGILENAVKIKVRGDGSPMACLSGDCGDCRIPCGKLMEIIKRSLFKVVNLDKAHRSPPGEASRGRLSLDM